MTSVQSAPAMAAGGTAVPGNLTHQHVQEVWQVCHYPLSVSV